MKTSIRTLLPALAALLLPLSTFADTEVYHLGWCSLCRGREQFFNGNRKNNRGKYYDTSHIGRMPCDEYRDVCVLYMFPIDFRFDSGRCNKHWQLWFLGVLQFDFTNSIGQD